MPAFFKIFPDRRLVFSLGKGVFTPGDYRLQMAQLQLEPAFKPEFNHLVDCRSIELLAFSGEEIRTVGTSSIFANSAKRAFVVASDVQYGLARMLATYRHAHDQQELQVFREIRDALDWLGLPADFDPSQPDASAQNPPGS